MASVVAQDEQWIADPEEEFELALKRKRSRSRPHFLFLRALHFLEKGDSRAARATLERALEIADPCERDFDRMRIETQLAQLDLKEGDDRAAEAIFRRLVNADSDLGGADGLAGIELAELLVKRGEIGEAEELLTNWFQQWEEEGFDIHMFRYAVCWVRLASTRGDSAAASTWASRALEVAGRPDEFSRHPGVGAARPTKELRDWLEETASCSGGLG